MLILDQLKINTAVEDKKLTSHLIKELKLIYLIKILKIMKENLKINLRPIQIVPMSNRLKLINKYC